MSDTRTSHLRRVLGLGFGLSVVVGGTIGIGILRTPGLVAGQLSSRTAIVAIWIVGGLYTLLGSICLTELGTMLPKAGGYYVYARRALGDWIGFAVGWTDWLTYCAVLGYVSIAMSEFLGSLIPSFAPATTPIAIAVLIGFVGLQWLGVRVSGWFQQASTAIKCLAFLALIVAALLAAPPGASTASALAAPTLRGVVAALQAVIITYGGWQSALYFTEEDPDPSRNLPRSMVGGVVAVLVIYVLVNIALVHVLPIAEMAKSKLPAADAAAALVGDRGRQFITVLSLVSLVPILNALMMIGTRILFALGRDGLVWSRASAVNAGGTPGVSTLLTTAVAVALIATGTFERLAAMVAFYLAANYCVTCLALVMLRRREPALARPFRAWGYPWTAAIVVAGAVVFLAAVLVGDTINGIAAMGLLAVGLAGRFIALRMS